MAKKFNLWQATSLVVGNIVGSGILMLPAAIAAYGSFGLVGWMLTSLGAIFLGLVFARLSHRFTESGGPYTYVRHVFGPFAGFQVAWTYWLANIISNLAVVIAFVSYLSMVFPVLKNHSLLSFCAGLLSLWFSVSINLLGVKLFARIQFLTTVLKVLPLFGLSIVGIFYVDWQNIFPLSLPSTITPIQAIMATMSLSIFSFIGIESATIPSGDVENAKKTVAKATVMGTMISAVIYIWITFVLMGVLGAAQLSVSNAPFADTFSSMFGMHFGIIISFLGAFSCLTTLNGWVLLQGQIPLSVARDGLFPKMFTRLTKGGAPKFALISSSLLMSMMLFFNYSASLLDQFSFIVNLTAFSILFPYLMSSFADMKLLWEEGFHPKKNLRIRSLLTSIFAILYTSVAIAGVGISSVLMGVLFISLGVPLYIYMRKKP